MDRHIQSFIEQHIDLIEEEDWKTFFDLAHANFFNSTVQELVRVLEAAGIDTLKARENCLEIHIQEGFSGMNKWKWDRDTPIALYSLVQGALNDHYGFEVTEIINYVWDHRENYSQYLKFGDKIDEGVFILI